MIRSAEAVKERRTQHAHPSRSSRYSRVPNFYLKWQEPLRKSVKDKLALVRHRKLRSSIQGMTVRREGAQHVCTRLTLLRRLWRLIHMYVLLILQMCGESCSMDSWHMVCRYQKTADYQCALPIAVTMTVKSPVAL